MAGTSMRLKASTRARAVRFCGESGIVRLVVWDLGSFWKCCALSESPSIALGDMDGKIWLTSLKNVFRVLKWLCCG